MKGRQNNERRRRSGNGVIYFSSERKSETTEESEETDQSLSSWRSSFKVRREDSEYFTRSSNRPLGEEVGLTSKRHRQMRWKVLGKLSAMNNGRIGEKSRIRTRLVRIVRRKRSCHLLKIAALRKGYLQGTTGVGMDGFHLKVLLDVSGKCYERILTLRHEVLMGGKCSKSQKSPPSSGRQRCCLLLSGGGSD